MADSTSIIRDLNDRLRHGDASVPRRIMITGGVEALLAGHAASIRKELFEQLRNFNAFTSDNDPYGEHDFGSFEYLGEKLFWKIDYFDTTLEFASPDPGDPTLTIRVLTIMLAEEY